MGILNTSPKSIYTLKIEICNKQMECAELLNSLKGENNEMSNEVREMKEIILNFLTEMNKKF